MKLRKQLQWIREDVFTLIRRHRGAKRVELVRRFVAGQIRMGLHRNTPAPGRSRLFDFDVAYFSEEAYLTLLHEVFIDSQYEIALPSQSPVIVDGGANIGVSVLWWKYLYPNARILAFEPDPDTFAMLERNVRENRLTDVRIVNTALGDDERDVILFHDAAIPGNLSMSTTQAAGLHAKRVVKMSRLSSHLTEPVDLLKLDIEGSEHEVIRDLATTGKLRLADHIVMEYHHHQNRDDDRLGEMLTTLEENGFGYHVGGAANMIFRRGEENPFLLFAYRKGNGPAV